MNVLGSQSQITLSVGQSDQDVKGNLVKQVVMSVNKIVKIKGDVEINEGCQVSDGD